MDYIRGDLYSRFYGITMNFEVLRLGHYHKMPSEYKPPPEYKPPRKCLRTSISPGLIFGILRYVRKFLNLLDVTGLVKSMTIFDVGKNGRGFIPLLMSHRQMNLLE